LEEKQGSPGVSAKAAGSLKHWDPPTRGNVKGTVHENLNSRDRKVSQDFSGSTIHLSGNPIIRAAFKGKTSRLFKALCARQKIYDEENFKRRNENPPRLDESLANKNQEIIFPRKNILDFFKPFGMKTETARFRQSKTSVATGVSKTGFFSESCFLKPQV